MNVAELKSRQNQKAGEPEEEIPPGKLEDIAAGEVSPVGYPANDTVMLVRKGDELSDEEVAALQAAGLPQPKGAFQFLKELFTDWTEKQAKPLLKSFVSAPQTKSEEASESDPAPTETETQNQSAESAESEDEEMDQAAIEKAATEAALKLFDEKAKPLIEKADTLTNQNQELRTQNEQLQKSFDELKASHEEQKSALQKMAEYRGGGNSEGAIDSQHPVPSISAEKQDSNKYWGNLFHVKV